MSFDMERIQRIQDVFDGCGNLAGCCLEADNGKVRQLVHAKQYIQNWTRMRQERIGLLFWGPPGTGKTFAAACIANAFAESRDFFAPSVHMTTFGNILRKIIACTPQEREDYFHKLLNCQLLILDDFGMERQTDFAREQVFQLINGRYLNGNPLVMTTNLTLQQMKNPQTMAEHRIYDRVLEMCVPVLFDGDSLRQEKAQEKMQLYKQLTDSACA